MRFTGGINDHVGELRVRQGPAHECRCREGQTCASGMRFQDHGGEGWDIGRTAVRTTRRGLAKQCVVNVGRAVARGARVVRRDERLIEYRVAGESGSEYSIARLIINRRGNQRSVRPMSGALGYVNLRVKIFVRAVPVED